MIISTVVTTAHLISPFGLGAGGRWALQMDTLPYTFSLGRHWLYHTVNEFPSATRWWHSQAVMAWQFWYSFFGLCHCIPGISTWRSKWSDWKRYENTNSMPNTAFATMAPQLAHRLCMLFIACSKTSRRAWHGSIDSGKLEECCIGWCSETCRIEWTCGCRTKILRNRAKLLKAILCYSHCLFDVSNLCSGCLSCTGKDRLDLERVTQIYHGTTGEMSEKKMSATAKPEQRPEGPRTPCWLFLPG